MSGNHMDSIAIRKSGIEGWQPYRYEVIGNDGYLITGGIPKILSRGPRKGKLSWTGCKSSSVVFTKSELNTERAQYSIDTGNCPECYGEAKTISSMNFVTGLTEYRECRDCKGTGKAGAA